MIKYYCDRCGRIMPQPKHKEVNICIRGILTVDLCDKCVEEFDKMALHFVKHYRENLTCFDCKYCKNTIAEEPCESCIENGIHMNFERADEEEEDDE